MAGVLHLCRILMILCNYCMCVSPFLYSLLSPLRLRGDEVGLRGGSPQETRRNRFYVFRSQSFLVGILGHKTGIPGFPASSAGQALLEFIPMKIGAGMTEKRN